MNRRPDILVYHVLNVNQLLEQKPPYNIGSDQRSLILRLDQFCCRACLESLTGLNRLRLQFVIVLEHGTVKLALDQSRGAVVYLVVHARQYVIMYQIVARYYSETHRRKWYNIWRQMTKQDLVQRKHDNAES